MLLLLAVAVAAAAFVQGTVGIGFALIIAPVLGLVAPSYLPGTLLILMLPLNVHIAWRERQAIDWRGAGWISLGRFFGTFLGLWLLLALTTRQMEVAVGLFTIAAALVALIAPPFAPRRDSAVGVGLFTGISETATGIGGPPLAMLYQHAPGPVLRSTVATCFLIGELLSLVFLAVGGRLEGPQLTAALTLMPAVLLGSAASRLVLHRVRGKALRVSVLVFAIAGSLVLILP